MALRKENEKKTKLEKKKNTFEKENNKKSFKNDYDYKSDITIKKPKNQENSNKRKHGSIKKQIDNYKEELESDDYGVESASKTSEKAFQGGKKLSGKAKDVYINRKQNKLRKADEEFYQNLVSKLDKEQKNNQSKPHSKLEKQTQNKSKNINKNIDKKAPKNINKKTNKNIDKKAPKNNYSFKNKVKSVPKKIGTSITDTSVTSYKENLVSEDQGIKTGVEGAKLSKEGIKSLQNVKRKQKNKGAAKKLRGKTTKLQTENKLTKGNINPKLNKEKKALQKRKIKRRHIYKNKAPKTISSVTSTTKNVGKKIKNSFKTVKKVVKMMFRRMLGTKFMVAVGGLFLQALPIFIIIGFLLSVVLLTVTIGGGGGKEEMENNHQLSQELSPNVEKWRVLVTDIADEKGMSDYVDLVLAIIQVETGGRAKDIMQSSESAGHPPNYFDNERDSIEQGVSHLKNVVKELESYNSDYLNDTKLIAQTYNFGLSFARYVGSNDYDGYNLNIAEKFSKDVVAESLGNTTGETYSYENSLSKELGKTYLYRNGGNFLYGEEIAQYTENGVNLEDGELHPPVQPMIATSGFGGRLSPGGIGSTDHKGIDLDCTGGVTPIESIQKGTIVKSNYVKGLGNTVIVKHGKSSYSTYAHMNSMTVTNGDKVNAGEQIGVCGTTGASTGPHLHLELSPEPHNKQIDPYPYIKDLLGG